MNTVRARRPALLAFALAVTLLATAAPQPAEAGHRRSRSDRSIANGVVFSRITESGPNQIRLITINPKQAHATTDVALASNSFPGWARTSQMARAHNAIAAVNGDFGISPGRPLHAFLMDGKLVQSGIRTGAAFASANDVSNSYADHPVVNVSAYVMSSRASFGIEKWNSGDPKGNEIAAYTPSGGSVERPPRGACSVRLQPAGSPTWTSSREGIQRVYSVQATASCGGSMKVQGGVVLSSRSGSTAATTLKGLKSGAQIRVTTSYTWPDILDSIGGNPQLVQNGRNVAPGNCGYFCNRNPRTGVGVTSDGKILIMTVDGRQSGWSVGMTLQQWANEFRKFGAVWAINLDGGGSTTMWVKGSVVNRPSDSTGERYVSSALLVLPGKDSGDPQISAPIVGGTSGRASAPPSAFARRSASKAQEDPASTGGLLDAVASGALGGSTRLSPGLRRDAAAFRASH